MDDPYSTDSAQTGAPPAWEAVPQQRFPWPPAEHENVLTAFVETCRRSLFEPVAFFRAMPPGGYGAALAYYLPIGIISAALELFWSMLFDVLGFSWSAASWIETRPTINPALERLLSFLFSPAVLLVTLFIGAALIHITLKILGAARHPYASTVRILAFSSGAWLLAIVPLIGVLAGAVWSAVLTVIGLREVHRTTTGRAVAALLLPIAFLLLGVVVLSVIAAVMIAALGMSMPTR